LVKTDWNGRRFLNPPFSVFSHLYCMFVHIIGVRKAMIDPRNSSRFIVLQLSPRRWVVAEQTGLFLANPEFRAVTRPFGNRVDAHAVCTELATRDPGGFGELTREHLLGPGAFRGKSYLRSQLLNGMEN